VHGLLASLCEQLEKGLHDFRVELAAGLAAERATREGRAE